MGATPTIRALIVAAATAAGANAQPGDVADPVPEDPRRAEWLCDQAEDVLTLVLPVEWLTSLFGVPSQEQAERARHAAGEIYALAGEAAVEVRRGVAAIESGPGYADDFAAQIERRRLNADVRDRRVPFLRGVGAYLHAALSPELDGRQTLYEEAIELLTPLMNDPSVRRAAKAQLYAGLATIGAGRFESANPLVRGVPTLREAGRWDIFASRMGQVSVLRGRGLEPALAGLNQVEKRYEATDPLRILIADRRFLLLSEAARDASGDERTALVRRAFEAYTALLDESPGPDHARAHILERLGRVVGARTPLDSLPEIVSVARARQLARADATRAQAIALLESLLQRVGPDSPERPEVLFELAWTLHDADREWPAYEQFARLAREHPASPRAEKAIEVAVTIAHGFFRRTPDDPARRAALHESLELLLSRSPVPATADRWRCVAGWLALDGDRYGDAVRHFDRIPPDSSWWPDAQFRLAEIMCLRARSDHGNTSGADAYRRFVDSAVEVESALVHAQADAAGPRAVELGELLVRLSLFRAEAFLALGEPQRALDELRLIGDDSPLAAAAVSKKIEAYRALGRETDDQRELQRLVAEAGDHGGRILADLIRSRRPPIDALLEQGDAAEAVVQAERELLGPAALLDRWLDTAAAAPGAHPRWRLEAAEAYRLAGRCDEALRLYAGLLESRPNLTAALFGQAECLFGMDDHHVEAMELYRDVFQLTVDLRDDHYWCSQLRMLEILSRMNPHTSTIAPYIQRLRQKDPELGGFRDEFDRLLSTTP